jgi:hypothetical protein
MPLTLTSLQIYTNAKKNVYNCNNYSLHLKLWIEWKKLNGKLRLKLFPVPFKRDKMNYFVPYMFKWKFLPKI